MHQFRIPKQLRRTLLVFLTLLFLLQPFFFHIDSQAAASSDKRTVRVAFFSMYHYNRIDENGNYLGMDADYLNHISRYANWKIEFVPVASWDEALVLLRSHKIDLIGNAQYIPGREQDSPFATLPHAYNFSAILVRPESKIARHDFQAMKNLRYGLTKNFIRHAEFLHYLEQHGIEQPEITEYETEAELRAGLDAHEIDAWVSYFLESDENARIIGEFATTPLYYISYKGNEDLLSELDNATLLLRRNEPDFENKLLNHYYFDRLFSQEELSLEELQYLQQKSQLVVGYFGSNYPFSYEEDGEFSGLARILAEHLGENLNLKIRFEKFPDERAAYRALREGTADILSYNTESSSFLENRRLLLSRQYATSNLVIVSRNERASGSSGPAVYATTPSFHSIAEQQLKDENVEIKVFDGDQDCLNALVDKRVQFAILESNYIENILRTDEHYSDLRIRYVLNTDIPINFVVSEQQQLLADILQKKIIPLSDYSINEYVLQTTSYSFMSIKGILHHYQLYIIAVVLFLSLLFILFGFYSVHSAKKIRRFTYRDITVDAWNLSYWILHGQQWLHREKEAHFAVVNVGIPDYQHFITLYGNQEGDRLLRFIGSFLYQEFEKEQALSAKNSGARFILLLKYKDRESLLRQIRDLKKNCENAIYQENSNRISICFGIYQLKPQERDLSQVLNYVDVALNYAMENVQQDIFLFDQGMQLRIEAEQRMEKLLSTVDLKHFLLPYFQPKVDIRNGTIVGAEALVRMRDPENPEKILAPIHFIPYYERTGQVKQVDLYIFEESCRLLRHRLDQKQYVVPISCNFSRLHFLQDGFSAKFEAISSEISDSEGAD